MASTNRAFGMAVVIVALLLTTSCTNNEPSAPAPAVAAPTPAPTPAPAVTPTPQQAPETPVVSTADKNASLEQCREKLKAAAQLDLLKDMSFDNGRPRVVIGPTWYQIDFSAKEGLAQTAACFFLAGDSTKAIRFDITDSMTGKPVATWSYTKLVVK
jgi:hypothetical protein